MSFMPPLSIPQITALVVVTIGMATDLHNGKIYNWLTFPAALLGIAMQAYYGGLHGALMGMAGWLVGTGIMTIPHLKEKIWFGDVKLVAAIGAFTGPGMVLLVYLYFSIFFGLHAALRLLFVFPWRQLALALFFPTGTKSNLDLNRVSEALKSAIPLGPDIFLGTVVAFVFEKPTLHFLGFG